MTASSVARAARARVLVVAPCLHGADGVSVVSRQIVRALDGIQLDVSTWVLDDVSQRDLVDRPVRDPDYRARGRVDLVLRGLWSASRESFDRIVVSHLHLLPAVVGYMARGARIAVYLHGIECWRPLGTLRETLLSQADVLLANSSYTARRFVRENPRFADRPVHICPPAVPDDIDATEPPSTPAVLAVGRLSSEERYKGHDALLNIWPSVVARVPAARLTFIGDGDDRGRLEARIRSEGVGASVTSLGLVSRAALRDAYAACRVFALPSGGEGFGIVFLEAMAAGRACVGAFGAAEEIIEADRTGALVAAGDETALSDVILRLLTDDDLCRAMGRAGRERALEHFSHRALAAKLVRALGDTTTAHAVEC